MRKLLLAATALVNLADTANASGWEIYYDCGNRVVPVISGWHGKKWLRVQENQEVIFEERKFYDGGNDALDKNSQALNADATNFRFRVKWHGKTVMLHFRDDMEKVYFADHLCREMGTRYDDEVQQYNEDFKNWAEQHK